MPWSGSPGCATIGSSVERSIDVDAAGVDRARVGRDRARAPRASTSISGRHMRSQRKVSSSAATMPPRAVHSVAMLASVARSSIDSAETPGPVNSITRLSVASGLAKSSRMWSIRSLAVTFARERRR